ncbi:hypothetical protein [Dyadobacter fermentans]|uniref:hypothetical protein n=1 Tax=Dyadobacter fermentans TaxID=94254 RepID=UPI0016512638|nr:hypothetical protein [Dyadobacter fermentans]
MRYIKSVPARYAPLALDNRVFAVRPVCDHIAYGIIFNSGPRFDDYPYKLSKEMKMKKLVMAAVAFAITVSATFAQSTTNSTNPNIQPEDTVKQNPASDRSTGGPRNTSDGARHTRQGKPDRASPAGRATNAGRRTNANNESKVSKGGKVNQAAKSNNATGKPGQAAKKDD